MRNLSSRLNRVERAIPPPAYLSEPERERFRHALRLIYGDGADPEPAAAPEPPLRLGELSPGELAALEAVYGTDADGKPATKVIG